MSVNDVNPSNLFGGEWEKINGRFLLGSDNTYKVGTTGGEARHTLTQSEIPNYLIGFLAVLVPGYHSQWTNGGIVGSNMDKDWRNQRVTGNTDESDPQWGYNLYTNGGSQSHNNMPPYIVVNIWKRVK